MIEEGRTVSQIDAKEEEAGEFQSERGTQPTLAGFEGGGRGPQGKKEWACPLLAVNNL